MTDFAWRVHPARDRPLVAIFGAAVTTAIGMLIGAGTRSFVAGGAATAVLVLSLRHFYSPTRYVIDEYGVSVRCLGVETHRSWARLRRFRYDDAGALLSTRARPSLLDSFTGLHLTWAGNKDEAVRVIERYMAATREG